MGYSKKPKLRHDEHPTVLAMSLLLRQAMLSGASVANGLDDDVAKLFWAVALRRIAVELDPLRWLDDGHRMGRPPETVQEPRRVGS